MIIEQQLHLNKVAEAGRKKIKTCLEQTGIAGA